MDLVQKRGLVVSATPELRATVANLKVKVEMQAAPALLPEPGNRYGEQRSKEQSSSPAPKAKTTTDVQSSNSRGESLAKKIRIPCKLRATCKIPSHSYWHPPVCHNHTSHSGCKYGGKSQFRHNDAEETPSKKSKKGSAKGSVALLKDSPNCGCVSQDSYPKKSVQQKVGKMGSNASAGHTVKFPGGTSHQIKIRERKGPPRGVIQKCEPHEGNPCAPRFEERSHEETSRQESWGRKAAWDLAKNILQAQKYRRDHVFVLLWK